MYFGEDSETINDEQLRAALSGAIGQAQFVSFRADRAASERFNSYLPRNHRAIRTEQYRSCAASLGLIYERTEQEGILLYRVGSPRPVIKPVTPDLDPKKAAAISAKVSEMLSGSAPAREKPVAVPAQNKIPDSPAEIAKAAAAIVENARKSGIAMSTTDAVRQVMQSNCAKDFDPNDAGSIALAARSIVETENRKGKRISYADAVNKLIGSNKLLDPNSPAAIALKARELVATTRNSGKFISYANAVAQVMSGK